MIIKIRKRDGREVAFNIEKIGAAIFKAAQAIGGQDYATSLDLAEKVAIKLEKAYGETVPSVENIQDLVEKTLIEQGHAKTAKEYILYRAERSKAREANTRLMKKFEKIYIDDRRQIKSPNETILEYARESSRQFYDLFFLNPDHIRAHESGDIYIDSIEYLSIMTNSIEIDLEKVLKNGFKKKNKNMVHGQDLLDYSKLIFTLLEENQHDQFGYQGLGDFDLGLKPGLISSFGQAYRKYFKLAASLLLKDISLEANIDNIFKTLADTYEIVPRLDNKIYLAQEKEYLKELIEDLDLIERIQNFAHEKAYKALMEKTDQAIHSLFYDLNNLKTNRGAQLINSSISYGTDTSQEGRFITSCLLRVSKRLLDQGFKLDYPVQIFKLKTGINLLESDPNFDLLNQSLELALSHGNFKYALLDASYNLSGPGKNQVAYSGDNLRIFENSYKAKSQGGLGRGNLSISCLNLPRLALESKGLEDFFIRLDMRLDNLIAQLLERFEMQGARLKEDYESLMGEGLWLESNQLGPKDELRQVLKHGSLSVGFLGLSQTLICLLGQENLKTQEGVNLGLKILGQIKARLDDVSRQYSMNFNLLGLESQKVARYFLEKDREKFGLVKGVTDVYAYTDSFYLPKDQGTYMDKIRLESNYHRFCLGGHNLRLSFNTNNLEVVRDIILRMQKANIGLFTIEKNKEKNKEKIKTLS